MIVVLQICRLRSLQLNPASSFGNLYCYQSRCRFDIFDALRQGMDTMIATSVRAQIVGYPSWRKVLPRNSKELNAALGSFGSRRSGRGARGFYTEFEAGLAWVLRHPGSAKWDLTPRKSE
jgi:hypothetical protein